MPYMIAVSLEMSDEPYISCIVQKQKREYPFCLPVYSLSILSMILGQVI